MQISSLAVHGCKNVLAERRRLFWVIVGLALGVGLYVAISIMAAGYIRLIALPFSQLNSDLIVQRAVQGREEKQGGAEAGIRLPFSNQPISGAEADALARLTGVEQVSRAIMLWYQENREFSIIAGVDPEDAGGPARVMSWIDQGRKIEKNDEVVVESHYAKFHQIKVGSQVTLGRRPFTVVGISKIKQGASVAAANYYMSLPDTRALAGMEADSANMLFAGLKTGVDAEQVLNTLVTAVPGAYGTTVDTIGNMLKGFARISATVSRLLGVVTLGFAVLVASWLVAGALHERGWQIGLLRSVGWRKKEILFSVAAETLLLGLIGGLCGLGLGYMAAVGLSQQGASVTLPWSLTVQPGTVDHNTGSGQSVALAVRLDHAVWITALAVAALSTTVSGTVVAWRQARLSLGALLERG